jgi:hypothetical protein
MWSALTVAIIRTFCLPGPPTMLAEREVVVASGAV